MGGNGQSRLCDDDRLWAEVLGALEGEQADVHASHLKDCARCRRQREVVVADVHAIREWGGEGGGPPDRVARDVLDKVRRSNRISRRVRIGAIAAFLIVLQAGALYAAHRITENSLARTELWALEHAVQRCRNATGTYPKTEAELAKAVAALPEKDREKVRLDDEGFPVDRWGRRYRYRFPGERVLGLFDLYSVGPDGVDEGGEEDDIASWR